MVKFRFIFVHYITLVAGVSGPPLFTQTFMIDDIMQHHLWKPNLKKKFAAGITVFLFMHWAHRIEDTNTLG